MDLASSLYCFQTTQSGLTPPERFQETLRPKIPVPHLCELFEVPSKSRQTVQVPGLVAASAPLLHGSIIVTEVERPEPRLPTLFIHYFEQHFGVAHRIRILLSVVRHGHDDVPIRPPLRQDFNHKPHPRLVVDRNALRLWQSACLFDDLQNCLHAFLPYLSPPHTGRTLPVRCFLCTAPDDRGSASPGTVLSLAHPAKVHDRVLRRPRSSSSHRPQTHNLPGSSQRGAPILEGTVPGGAAKPRTVSFAVSACGLLTGSKRPTPDLRPVSLRYYAIAPAGFDIAIGSVT